jgi:hypothetical protein
MEKEVKTHEFMCQVKMKSIGRQKNRPVCLELEDYNCITFGIVSKPSKSIFTRKDREHKCGGGKLKKPVLQSQGPMTC